VIDVSVLPNDLKFELQLSFLRRNEVGLRLVPLAALIRQRLGLRPVLPVQGDVIEV
jgi:hypothetical protein